MGPRARSGGHRCRSHEPTTHSLVTQRRPTGDAVLAAGSGPLPRVCKRRYGNQTRTGRLPVLVPNPGEPPVIIGDGPPLTPGPELHDPAREITVKWTSDVATTGWWTGGTLRPGRTSRGRSTAGRCRAQLRHKPRLHHHGVDERCDVLSGAGWPGAGRGRAGVPARRDPQPVAGDGGVQYTGGSRAGDDPTVDWAWARPSSAGQGESGAH